MGSYTRFDVNCHQGYDGISHIGTSVAGSISDAIKACDATDACNGFVYDNNGGIYELRAFGAGSNIEDCKRNAQWQTYKIMRNIFSNMISVKGSYLCLKYPEIVFLNIKMVKMTSFKT